MENQKRGRGRPKGSGKNKETNIIQNNEMISKPKGKRGRPKGSKNKNSTLSSTTTKKEKQVDILLDSDKEKSSLPTKKAMARNGEDYRQTAKRMREEFGFKMNHVSARNYTIRALEKIAFDLINAFHSNEIDKKNFDVHEIVQYPIFQEGIAEIMRIPE